MPGCSRGHEAKSISFSASLAGACKCFRLLISLRLVASTVVWHTDKRRLEHHNDSFVEAPALMHCLVASGVQSCSSSEPQHDHRKYL